MKNISYEMYMATWKNIIGSCEGEKEGNKIN